jgi:hypothetical protein
VTDRLIRITTALAVLAVAGVAAIISYQHAYELVSSHGEHRSPWTALSGRRRWWCWTRAGGTTVYHDWPR